MGVHADLRIHDLHRIVGHLPHQPSPTPTLAALEDDLGALGIQSCSAVHSWQLWGDPSGPDRDQIDLDGSDVVTMVPVVIPSTGDAGWPRTADDLLASGVRLVRACPTRHRWGLQSRVAMQWWESLAAAGCALSLDLEEVGFGAVQALARALPELVIVALNPGYRELRRSAELLDTCPAVLLETGTLNTAGALEWLATTAGADRLVFGTGGPIADDAGATWVLRHLDLPRDQVDQIAHGNALALLGGPR